MKGTFLESIRRGFGLSIGLSIGLATTAALGVTVSGTFHTFFAGAAISSNQVNENFSRLRTAIEGINPTPVGSIVAWHKSLAGTPTIPTGWVECNGQTVSDVDSVYNGQTLPDLNTTLRFLRGATASGTLQNDAFQGHRHTITDAAGNLVGRNAGGVFAGVSFSNLGGSGSTTLLEGRAIFSNGSHGTPRVDSETRPINMSVVWIIRIK